MSFFYYITVFGLGSYSGLDKIVPEQVEIRAFGKILVLFVLPKIIVVDVDRIVQGCSKRLSRRP